MRTPSPRIAVCAAVLALLAGSGRAQVHNDTCATATLIDEGLVIGDSTAAFTTSGMSCGIEFPFVHDVWYRLEPAQKGLMVATFGCNGSNFDPGLFLSFGDCELYGGCNDDSCGFNSKIQTMVYPSLAVQIGVAGLQGTGGFGQFVLKVTVDRISQRAMAATRVGSGVGGFPANQLSSGDDFGDVAALGDFNRDGLIDVAVGAPGADEPFSNSGAVWLVCLSVDGKVLTQFEITGAFGGLTANANFGAASAGLGDLNGDGTLDLAVGAPGDTAGGLKCGSVRVLFLAPDGSVVSSSKLSQSSGGFGGALDLDDRFGSGLAAVGDIDGDGVVDLAAGAERDDDGGMDAGAVWILFLNADGTVKASQKISPTSGGFAGALQAGDHFGADIGAAGDIDGDGVPDLAVGAPFGGATDQGVVWTVLLNDDGTVKAAQPIVAPPGFAPDAAATSIEFGAGVCGMGDLDGDGVPDLAVGAPSVDHVVIDAKGAVFVVYLSADGTQKSQALVTDLEYLSYFWGFRIGRSVAFPGDVDGDGHVDLLIGDAGQETSSTADHFMTVFLDLANAWKTLAEGALEGGNTYAPELRGEGTLQPGTPWSLELAIAARNSPAAFVAGFSTQFHPFKGGVLVPAPDLVISGLVTDSEGRIELGGLWPPGAPSGAQVWLQAWVVDSGGPAGFAASNAVLGTVP